MRLTSIAKIFPALLVVLSIGFLGFIAGTYVVFADAFPARYVTDAYRGGQALISKMRDYNDPFPGTLWQPVQKHDARGHHPRSGAQRSRAHALHGRPRAKGDPGVTLGRDPARVEPAVQRGLGRERGGRPAAAGQAHLLP